MKNIVSVALLSAFIAAPVLAADTKADGKKFAVGGGYGFGNDGVISVRGDFDISDMVGHPVKARVGWDNYTQDFGNTFFGSYKYSYNVYYGGAYYDFNQALRKNPDIKLGDKIHPFAGLGFGIEKVSLSCSGSSIFCSGYSSGSNGTFYYIGGVQYNVTPNIDAEISFSDWAGLSLGGNFRF